MADKYIARVKTTTALALAGLGDGHTAIVTDGLYEHVHRIGSNYHFLTADKYWNGAAYNYNDRTFGAVTTLGDINIPNAESINAKNAAGSAYRKLIGLDASNVLKIGQDTDIAAVTFGTTSELARLNSSGLGVGCTPTVMLHAESATTTEMLLKNTGDNAVNLFFDAARTTGYGRGVGYLYGKWAGNTVTRIGFITGADDTNKDDGWILFSTATGGSLTQKMLLGYQLPIVEIGNPTTEDDATVWANTQTVLRVGTGLSILDFQSSSKSYPELLFNAQCTNPGVTYKARQTGRAYRIRGNCASTSGTFAINIVDDTSAGAAITWLSPIIITTTAVIIGQAFNLQLGNVAQAATQFTWDKYVTIKDMNGTTYYVPVCTGAPT
jgi:hypothetical protein